MPIASAISGIEMPGRSRTSSSACLARVPLPRGRLLQALVLLDERAQLLHARADLTLLLFQEISHGRDLTPARLTRNERTARRRGLTVKLRPRVAYAPRSASALRRCS